MGFPGIGGAGRVYVVLQNLRRAIQILFTANRFIDVGGYKLLNNWLTYSKTTNNLPLLQQILLTLQHLPLTVDHLKQVPSVFMTPVLPFWCNLTDEKLIPTLMWWQSWACEVEWEKKRNLESKDLVQTDL